MLDHERALVDICSNDGESSDSEVDQCVLDFLKEGYVGSGKTVNGASAKSDDEEPECSIEDDGTDCLIDDMHNMWAEEMTPLPSQQRPAKVDRGDDVGLQKQVDSSVVAGADGKPKPWSSRSSPSGTYVRDPVTGEMKNVDA